MKQFIWKIHSLCESILYLNDIVSPFLGLLGLDAVQGTKSLCKLSKLGQPQMCTHDMSINRIFQARASNSIFMLLRTRASSPLNF